MKCAFEIAALMVCALAVAAAAATAAPQKKLIEYGWDVPPPTYVAQHIRDMEQRPFDGLIMRLPKIGQVFENRKWDPSDAAADFDALPKIKWDRFTDNFIIMFAASTMDWFSDADWENVLHNVTLCAQAARLGGCKGLCFDAEPYGNNPWRYPDQPRAKDKTYEEYQAVVRKRGAQFMSALQSAFPRPVVHTFFLLSLFRGKPAPDDHYAMLPAFLNGMLDSAAPGAVITDGNESSYYYDNEQQYQNSRRAIHNAANGPLVAPENRARYRQYVRCSQALYVDHLFDMRDRKNISAFMTPRERARWFEHNTFWALTTSDRYVWLYSEKMNWWTNENLPPGLDQAVVSAREKVAQGKPLGFDLWRIITRARARSAIQLQAKLVRRIARLPRLAPGESRPSIDGALSDPAWNNAAAFEPFLPLFSLPPDSVSARTHAWAAYDDRALYLAVRCDEPNIPALHIVGSQRDDNVWDGDSVDFFLAPGPEREPYYHIIINPNNVRWDAIRDKADDLSWNPKYDSAASRGPDHWSLELALPWAALNMKAPSPGARLFGNICRQRGNAVELSAWSQTVGGFLEPQNFGTLLLD